MIDKAVHCYILFDFTSAFFYNFILKVHTTQSICTFSYWKWFCLLAYKFLILAANDMSDNNQREIPSYFDVKIIFIYFSLFSLPTIYSYADFIENEQRNVNKLKNLEKRFNFYEKLLPQRLYVPISVSSSKNAPSSFLWLNTEELIRTFQTLKIK